MRILALAGGGVWVELGHASLFAFLVKDLGLSNGAAAYRKAAVDLAQRFPRVLEHLRSGELCMTTVFELSKVVTDANADEVIPRFFGASRCDAQNVVAELAPPSEPLSAAAPRLPTTSMGRLADRVRANSCGTTQEGPNLGSPGRAGGVCGSTLASSSITSTASPADPARPSKNIGCSARSNRTSLRDNFTGPTS